MALGGCLILLVATAGFGIGLSLVHIRAIAERQIALDRCTGREVLALKKILIELEGSYARLEAARIRTLPLLATPDAVAALALFKQEASIEQILEKGLHLRWQDRELRWNTLTGAGCRIHDHPARTPYPPFHYPIVDPETAILDLRGTRFIMNTPQVLRLRIEIARLESEATLTRSSFDGWKARWTQ